MGVGPPSRRDPGSVPITSWVNNVDSEVLDCNGEWVQAGPGTRQPLITAPSALDACSPPSWLTRA